MARTKKVDNKVDATVKQAAQVMRTLPRSSDVIASLTKTLSAHGLEVKPQPKGKPERWEMILDARAKVAATQWIEAKTVCEAVEARLDNAKALISAYAEHQMISKIFDHKCRPSNPQIVLRDSKGEPDHQFLFQFQDKFKVEFKKIPDGVDHIEYFCQLFESVGLTAENAKSIVENEFDFSPVTGIRSLTELLDGRYGEGREWMESSPEEKSAGAKLAALLMWDGSSDVEPLTPQEKSIVVKQDPGVVVKSGFYDRVATYCETLEQLEAIFSIVKPVCYPSHSKFAINDTETSKTQRKIAAVTDILVDKE